jgi:hypothetical protein
MMDPQALYTQLGVLVQTMPNLATEDPFPPDTLKWLGDADALVSELGDTVLVAQLRAVLEGGVVQDDLFYRASFAKKVELYVYRALAIAEKRAPAAAQGAFIPAGNVFDVMVAMGKVLGSATSDVLIVDPYMDEKALTDFALLVPEGVPVKLMADDANRKPTLEPARARWVQQWGNKRPLTVKVAPPRTLHDRLIVVDGQQVSVLTQSLNAFAARSPGTIVRVDPETAALKVEAYQDIWDKARQLQ